MMRASCASVSSVVFVVVLEVIVGPQTGQGQRRSTCSRCGGRIGLDGSAHARLTRLGCRDAADVAAKYSVSRAWVHRLQQRRRETGSTAPQKQTRWRTPILTAQLP